MHWAFFWFHLLINFFNYLLFYFNFNIFPFSLLSWLTCHNVVNRLHFKVKQHKRQILSRNWGTNCLRFFLHPMRHVSFWKKKFLLKLLLLWYGSWGRFQCKYLMKHPEYFFKYYWQTWTPVKVRCYVFFQALFVFKNVRV